MSELEPTAYDPLAQRAVDDEESRKDSIHNLNKKIERLDYHIKRDAEISECLEEIGSHVDTAFSKLDNIMAESEYGFGYPAYNVQEKLNHVLAEIRMEKLYLRNRTKRHVADRDIVLKKIEALSK